MMMKDGLVVKQPCNFFFFSQIQIMLQAICFDIYLICAPSTKILDSPLVCVYFQSLSETLWRDDLLGLS